jgi:hypothetical protein
VVTFTRHSEPDLIRKLSQDTSLWPKLKADCLSGEVFMAFRSNCIDFYHKGGRLFTFDNDGFKTHVKYASVIDGNPKDYVTESDLKNCLLIQDFGSKLERIKENCSKFSGDEALGVSDIYHRHSYLSNDNVVVLDIEVAFPGFTKRTDRIDVLLYNKSERRLRFVEAKHYSNNEIWSTQTPEVIDQINRYQGQIANNTPSILSEYITYLNDINSLFSLQLSVPASIDPQVELFLFGFDKDERDGKLKTFVKDKPEYANIKGFLTGGTTNINMESFWKGNL